MFLTLPHAPQQRDVLARGVQHNLDRRVGEHRGEWGGVERLQRVEQRDPQAVRRVGVVGDDLDEAQQRAVAALRHELGVDPEPAAGARERCDARDLVVGGERGGRRSIHRRAS
jgi:hypothetical protein